MNDPSFFGKTVSAEPVTGNWIAQDKTLRRDPKSLLGKLAIRPERFEPFQALRLLDRWIPGIRFTNSARKSHLGHPVGLIEERVDDARVPIDLIGLIGPQGTLPTPYLDQAVIEKRRRNGAFGAFLDVFNDRLIRLLGLGSEKYHLAGQLTRASLRGTARGYADEPRITGFIYALCGFGTPDLRARLSLSDDVILYYAGLLTQRPPSMANLKALLGDFLKLPVEILPFRTQWLDLPAEEQTSLRGAAPTMAVLGRTAVSGNRVAECQSHFRIVVGPCGRRDFESLSAGSTRLRNINDLVTLFVGLDKTFDLQVILKREDVPDCRLGGSDAVTLGWNAWPANLPLERDPDEAVQSHAVLNAPLRLPAKTPDRREDDR